MSKTSKKKAIRREWILKCKYEVLTESSIIENQYIINWPNICQYQTLSESFIIKFREKVNWRLIFQYQLLSEAFICNYSDYILKWYHISYNKKILTYDFIMKYKNKLDMKTKEVQFTLNRQKHANMMFVKNDILSEDLNNVVLSFV